jgi:hypothetical protein
MRSSLFNWLALFVFTGTDTERLNGYDDGTALKPPPTPLRRMQKMGYAFLFSHYWGFFSLKAWEIFKRSRVLRKSTRGLFSEKYICQERGQNIKKVFGKGVKILNKFCEMRG